MVGYNFSEKNGMWKGSKVGLEALHIWVTKRKPKTKFCGKCKKSPPLDLANISQKYKRDLSDWEWLCRRCHMVKDGRLKKFLSFPHIRRPPIICKICKSLKEHCGRGLCQKCYDSTRWRQIRKKNKKGPIII